MTTKIFDWEWCRITDPMCDPGHLLSPITTQRLNGRVLSHEEEARYAHAYVEARGDIDASLFWEELARVRPAVVLHSAAWTAAWVATRSQRGALHDEALAPMRRQLEPEQLELLTQGGYW